MLVRFNTLAEAVSFAARRRSEGFLAELCDEAVSSLWGPLTVGGVAVITSDVAVRSAVPDTPDIPSSGLTSWNMVVLAALFFQPLLVFSRKEYWPEVLGVVAVYLGIMLVVEVLFGVFSMWAIRRMPCTPAGRRIFTAMVAVLIYLMFLGYFL